MTRNELTKEDLEILEAIKDVEKRRAVEELLIKAGYLKRK